MKSLAQSGRKEPRQTVAALHERRVAVREGAQRVSRDRERAVALTQREHRLEDDALREHPLTPSDVDQRAQHFAGHVGLRCVGPHCLNPFYRAHAICL